MQLAGQRGNLVGMVRIVPHHLCATSFDAQFANFSAKHTVQMKPIRGQYLRKWLKGRGLDHSIWDFHQH
jgi:hypothetical protein